MKRIPTTAAALLLLAGCSTTPPAPTVAQRLVKAGVSDEQAKVDSRECTRIGRGADQATPNPAGWRACMIERGYAEPPFVPAQRVGGR